MISNIRIQFARVMYTLMGGLLLLVSSSVYAAATVKDLYNSEIQVQTRDDAEFKSAAQQALRETLIRVTGTSNIEGYDGIPRALGNAKAYVAQFGYEKTMVLDAETQLPKPAYTLKISFDQRGVERLLRRAGLPIWTANRPEVLIWMGHQNGAERELLTSGAETELQSVVSEQMQRRGVPFDLPVYDLEDQMAVNLGDIWGIFSDRIKAASERYNPDAILMGKVYPIAGGQFRGAWLFMFEGQDVWLEVEADSLESLIAQASDWAADKLGQRYAVLLDQEGNQSFVLARVDQVNNLQDFARLNEYLEHIIAIRQIELVELVENKVTFKLYLDSELNQLKQLLELDGKLVEKADATYDVLVDAGVTLSVNEEPEAPNPQGLPANNSTGNTEAAKTNGLETGPDVLASDAGQVNIQHHGQAVRQVPALVLTWKDH